MDMTTCVARRTRSRTESYMNSLLNKAKGIIDEDQSEGSLGSRKEKKRASYHNTCSPMVKTKRRRRKESEDDDDVEFVGTYYPEGKRECEIVEDDDNVNSHTLESKSSDLGRDFDFASGKEKPSNLTPSALEISQSDEVIVEIPNSDEEVSIEDLGIDPSVEFSDEDDDIDEDVDSETSDYMAESSDSSYIESSDSDGDWSEDEGVAAITAKVRKSPSERVYNQEKPHIYPKKNDLDVFELLAKSIWERTKISEEDISSEDETAETEEVDIKEEDIAEERSSYKVYDQRKRRRFHREKEKKKNNHLNVIDLLGKAESFDGGENPWEDLPPLNLRFGCVEEDEVIEKTEEEKEIDRLWEDMSLALSLERLHSSNPAKNGDDSCSNGKHDFVLDEEIGLKCFYCSYVAVEIKDISPAMDKYHTNFIDKRTGRDRKGDPLLNKLEFKASDQSSYVASLSNTEGTVWEYIPGIKDTLYPHQQEGFEFIGRI